jgi:hypothetical protein
LEALDIMRVDRKPDLVLMDVRRIAPDLKTFIREIRSITALEGLPIVALIEAGNLSDLAGYLEEGCDDFLLKPVNQRLLFQRIQSLLETHPRAHNRVPCRIVAEASTGAELVTGEIREIGEGGVGLLLDRRLQPGDIIKITFTLPRGPEELIVGGEIIYVEKYENRHHHGVSFVIIDGETSEKIKAFIQGQMESS